MKRRTLILRNLRYYWRPYLAILAGVMVSTAVITGALLVGDSVKGSLERITELRLGKTRWAMQPAGRFFRTSLAGDLSGELNTPVIPVLQLPGIGINPASGDRVPDVMVTGVNGEFSRIWDRLCTVPLTDEAIISENLAVRLGLKEGDPLLIRLPVTGQIPHSAPFMAEEIPATSILLTVRAVSGIEEMGRFSLKINQQAPMNAFVPLELLEKRTGIVGMANILLIPGTDDARLTTEHIDTALSDIWRIQDAGILIDSLEQSGDFQITSDRIFIDDLTAQAIRSTVPGAKSIYTYLVNTISSDRKKTPYSFVAAVDEGLLTASVRKGEIMVTDWLASDLDLRQGDSIHLEYYIIGPLRRLQEKKAGFKVSGIVPVGKIPSGREMMPDFPGLSTAGYCRDWETGTPVDLELIREKDENYWNRFRGTPKAFITLADGKALWTNPFGTGTAFRFHPGQYGFHLSLDPDWYGFTFRPVFDEGKQAALNSTDFGELFLSLSFFLIASSLLLTALLASLHARTRLSETGVMAGLGFTKKGILSVLVNESLIVAIPGALLGTLAGIAYDQVMITGLNTLWRDAVRTSAIQLIVDPTTLLSGAATGLILSVTVLSLTIYRQLRYPVAGLVKGTVSPVAARLNGHGKVMLWTGILLVAASLVLVAVSLAVTGVMDSALFLVSGGMMMAGTIFLILGGMKRQTGTLIRGTGSLIRLAMKAGSSGGNRNAAAIALLALGTFTVVITGANRKTFYGNEENRQSGTGGFLLWGETTVPLRYDLNTPAGRSFFGLDDEPVLEDVRYLQLQSVDGDDASCLNLNQVRRPVMLGIPGREFDRLSAFRIAHAISEVDPLHPWLYFEKEIAPGIIPAFADRSVITWGLGKKLGDTLFFSGEAGEPLRLVLACALDNSIFQGHILVSDSLLRRYYPSAGGAGVILVDGPSDRQIEIGRRLESLFTDYGMVTMPASGRLAVFNSVENTYLSVFMILGALGVLIGTVGFGIILWRNNLERAPELEVLTALGFSGNMILKLLVTEYFIILMAGMGAGIAGALAGILPSLISPAYHLPGWFLIILLAMIWISGLLWIIIPARLFLRKDLMESLRRD